MTDPSTADRLAALQARRAGGARPTPTPAPVTDVTAELTAPPSIPRQPATTVLLPTSPATAPTPTAPPAPPGMLRVELPWARVATGGASIVSFAAMVVAMGPLLDGVETTEVAAEQPVGSLPAAQDATPIAPPVSIATTAPVVTVAPAGAGAPATIAVSSSSVPAAPDSQGAQPPATQPPVTEPPATQAPATQPPATEPPAAQAPATAAPATQPPATQAPTSQAPATTAPTATPPPTTAPPATAAPTTAPPRTDGSG